MKFFAVFAALIAAVAASHSTWTLSQLSQAIQNPHTDPALMPYLEHALNEAMSALYAGHQVEAVTVTIPSVDLSGWTLNQISEALQNPETDPALVIYLEHALNEMMSAIFAEEPITVTPVVVPAMDVTHWSLHELSEALQNPTTNPALVPYLEHALNEMMSAIYSGETMEIIAVVVPAGLEPVVVVPAPVEAPVIPAPVEGPVGPAPVGPSTPSSPSSPLVQIVINIKDQQQQPQPAVPLPVNPIIVPAPIRPEPVVSPSPVIIPYPVDGAAIVPEPVGFPSPVIIPQPVANPSPAMIPNPAVILN